MTGAPLLVYGGTVDGAPTAVPAGFTGLFAG
ncbi:MAG: hypothetical protein QOJ50_1438, partial [Cryptosporangiaceae bacterium]|nr:hypothetical protein [Cryptosporangiaceae bacterium]